MMDSISLKLAKFNEEEITRAIGFLSGDGATVELRAMHVAKQGTVLGYFDSEHRREMVQAGASLSGKAPGVYVTLNPVIPELLARAANRVKPFAKDATKDNEILRRLWLPIDFDPKRPSGISSTDAEHQAALNRALDCRDYLRKRGWPDPIYADSGNGSHLLYRIDLPNDSASTDVVRRILETVATHFGDSVVDVDRSVFNPARIWKLYGTLSAKGDHTPERPHRLARILEVPTND